MATSNHVISVLAGPTCPTCASDDLRWGAPLGALLRAECRDCGTESRFYRCDIPAPTRIGTDDIPGGCVCSACGCSVNAEDFCEDCAPSDCLYCGRTTHRRMLSENLACNICEEVA